MKKKKGIKGSRDRGIKTEAQVIHELQVHLMVLEKEAKALCDLVERTKQKLIEIITSQALTPTLSQVPSSLGPSRTE